MSINKIINAKEVAMMNLKKEQKTINALLLQVIDQATRLEVEGFDLKNLKKEKDQRLGSSSTSVNPTTPIPSMVDQVSFKPVQVAVETHINDTDLDLSMAPASGFKSKLDFEENSDDEDSI